MLFLGVMGTATVQVRSEDSYQRHGMTVRHVIDTSSPLYSRSREELEAMNAQFCLTVVSEEGGFLRDKLYAVFLEEWGVLSEGSYSSVPMVTAMSTAFSWVSDAWLSFVQIGIERSSMQAVFHMHDYFVADDEVIWNALFEDMLSDDGKGGRIADHNRLSDWKIQEL